VEQPGVAPDLLDQPVYYRGGIEFDQMREFAGKHNSPLNIRIKLNPNLV
jgi:hypothetical protein